MAIPCQVEIAIATVAKRSRVKTGEAGLGLTQTHFDELAAGIQIREVDPISRIACRERFLPRHQEFYRRARRDRTSWRTIFGSGDVP